MIICFTFQLICSPGKSRSVATGAQLGTMHPIQIWTYPLGILQNFEDRRAVQPARNTRDTLPHPLVVSVDQQWLETAHFQKYLY